MTVSGWDLCKEELLTRGANLTVQGWYPGWVAERRLSKSTSLVGYRLRGTIERYLWTMFGGVTKSFQFHYKIGPDRHTNAGLGFLLINIIVIRTRFCVLWGHNPVDLERLKGENKWEDQ